MGKHALIAQKEREAQAIEEDIAKLKRELEELKRALSKVKIHHESYSDTMNSYKKIEISGSHWKGQTKTKSDDHLNHLTSAVDNVKTKFEEAVDDLESDVSKKEAEIANAELKLAAVNTTITALKLLL
ncbi:YwqH-like family protein [Staphylococcus chromogenes]|uniref:YwqH-like family protein n=1 Tax=Staphylococcus chromogenes TaxID=46126 RepID=UPI000D023857|nr:DUF5082 family protein [Staphylococcus chromogenes]MCE5044131.1 DUF5082 family protein [Staphylococcus chromogenes]MDT0680466.1 DUF5082 family protein [Staphylococcus chromogenes]MDT0715745.1 DUF5082 family protein [Staphylococcus chromogenes]MDT0735933.1 DUF5082 family protein [Staphylococcus chromogenes]MDT0749320.1 DUF5082 family protein [Staphylococcus chromogenes]